MRSWLARAVPTTAAMLSIALSTAAHGRDPVRTKPGVDPRQSGLDVAFLPVEPRAPLDRWVAHFDLDLVSWIRQSPWPRAGASTPPRDDPTGLGYHRFALGLGLGHGFGDIVVAGLRLHVESTRVVQRVPSPAERSPKSVGLAAMPYVELIMVRKKRVRPYLMVRGGLGGSVVTTDGRSPLDSRATTALSMLQPTVGFGMGAHAFVTSDISIDGSVTMDHRWDFVRAPGPAPDPAAVAMGTESITERGRHNAFGRRLTTSLVISVSRWF